MPFAGDNRFEIPPLTFTTVVGISSARAIRLVGSKSSEHAPLNHPDWPGRGNGPYTITVDDDPIIVKLIEKILGMPSVALQTADELDRAFQSLSPAGVFVDIHLAEGQTGLSMVPRIKARWPYCPVIVITSDNSETMVGRALAMGADDFVSKPFRPGEVLARFLARKAEIDLRNNQTLLVFGDLTLNLAYRTVTGPKGESFLSPRESDILALLIRSKGVLLDREHFKARVWGNISVSDNALDRKLYEVRRAVKTVSDTVQVHSVYGQGIELKYS